ncbi:MAG TPA: ribosome maturation factor RimM [Hyphomonadaceae bacterium]|nr:ribosome maturation factor RimM [Hyphomonadaceae bacterium]
MSDKPKLIVVAQITGAFGVKGEARVRSFTENPEDCFSYGALLDESGEVVLTPVKHRALNEGFGVTAKENRQREEWEAMRGTLLHAAREAMPETDEEEGEIYVADLLGMAVVHVDGRTLGQVKAAHDFGAGDLIEVQPETGASFLLPFTEDVFPEIDMEARVLRADPDEGYLPDGLQRQKSDGRTN